jgi:hypothetical protein
MEANKTKTSEHQNNSSAVSIKKHTAYEDADPTPACTMPAVYSACHTHSARLPPHMNTISTLLKLLHPA